MLVEAQQICIILVIGEHVGVFVWNKLAIEFYPTQILSYFLTIQEHFNKALNQVSFAYLEMIRLLYM
jgi:ornithine carbamoyltransferase